MDRLLTSLPSNKRPERTFLVRMWRRTRRLICMVTRRSLLLSGAPDYLTKTRKYSDLGVISIS